MEFSKASQGTVRLRRDVTVTMPEGVDQDFAVEYPSKGEPFYRIWSDGKLVRGPEKLNGLMPKNTLDFPAAKLNLGSDFTASVKYETTGSGVLFPKMCRSGCLVTGCKSAFYPQRNPGL